ncbi:MAG: cell division protein FtsA [Deltaproteobacteria bacterium]|jgi:cell division protein FtsA|nr:cell division protein FtsA [Deltaproteobacteria bacterium]
MAAHNDAHNDVAKEAYVALDVGTTKVCCLVGEIGAGDETVEIMGMGIAPNCGLTDGRVSNVKETVEAISTAAEAAAEQSGFDLASVLVGIAGEHIKGLEISGNASVRTGKVEEDDVNRVIQNAVTSNIGAETRILAKVPLGYRLDGRPELMNPLGLTATTMIVRLQVFTVDEIAYQDLLYCVQEAGLKTSKVILESVASADAVLHPSEKEEGVILCDLGGGTTDLSLFYRGAVHHVYEIAQAGRALTNDLAEHFRIPADIAAQLKEEHGFCHYHDQDDVEMAYIEVANHAQTYSVKVDPLEMCHCLQNRLNEIFSLLCEDLKKTSYANVAKSVVLTGGTAKLRGLPELCREHFNLQVRVGYPLHVTGQEDLVKSPIYSTAVGLLLHGPKSLPLDDPPAKGASKSGSSFWSRIKRFFFGD